MACFCKVVDVFMVEVYFVKNPGPGIFICNPTSFLSV